MRNYLQGLAFALPASLVFTAYRGFNVAVSRPKAVMALQVVGLALKVPLNALFVFGADLPTPLGHFRLPALGTAGCGIATAIVMWCQLLAAVLLLRRDPFYAPFGLGRRLGRPSRDSLGALLKLGVPMGLSILIEVTGFTFMAFFISRIGATVVAGHQIAVNMVSMMYMVPLSIANASSVLVAQRIGAGDAADARHIGWAGLEIGVLVAAVLGSAVYLLRETIVGLYTSNPVIVAAALPLLAWVALFHLADAAQTIAAFVLRAYRIATVPMVVYVIAIWVIGLGGGYVAAFDVVGNAPSWMRGVRGFWAMATIGLACAGIGMVGFLAWKLRRDRRESARLEFSVAGSSIVKQLPPPSRASQRTVPPWRSAICLTSDRPRPTPPACSAWPGMRKKGSKMRSRIATGTPGPRSQTCIAAPPRCSGRSSTAISSPP